jgi:hypothetical protein
MSSTYVYGENVIFTSRSANPVITLRPENGKTLSIENVGIGLVVDKTTTQLGLYELNSPTNIFYNNAQLELQGTDISLAREANYLVVSGPNPNTEGGGGVFLASLGTFAQQAILTSSLTSTSFHAGLKCHINELGTGVVMESQNNSGGELTYIDFYSRSGTSWTLEHTETNFSDAKISGNHVIIGAYLGKVSIYLNTGGVWTFQQTLQDFTTSGLSGDKLAISKFGSNYGALAVYNKDFPNRLSVNTRTGTTWTELQQLYCYSGDTAFPTALEVNDTIITASSAERVYIWELNSLGSFELTATIDEALVTKLILGSTKLALYKGHLVNLYIRDSASSEWTFSSNKVLTADTSIAMNDNFLAVGKSGTNAPFGSADVYSLDAYSPIETRTVSSIETADKILMTSEFPITIGSAESTEQSVKIIGGLTVSGPISGTLIASYSKMSGSTAQSITNGSATDTILASVFSSVQGCTNLLTDITTGKLIAAKAGYYMVSGSFTFASNATGYRNVKILRNAADCGVNAIVHASDDTSTQVNLSGIVYLAVNQYLQVKVNQTSGGALDVTYAWFNAILLGS